MPHPTLVVVPAPTVGHYTYVSTKLQRTRVASANVGSSSQTLFIQRPETATRTVAMATRRIVGGEKTILEKDDHAEEKSNIAPAVPG